MNKRFSNTPKKKLWNNIQSFSTCWLGRSQVTIIDIRSYKDQGIFLLEGIVQKKRLLPFFSSYCFVIKSYFLIIFNSKTVCSVLLFNKNYNNWCLFEESSNDFLSVQLRNLKGSRWSKINIVQPISYHHLQDLIMNYKKKYKLTTTTID